MVEESEPEITQLQKFRGDFVIEYYNKKSKGMSVHIDSSKYKAHADALE